MSLDLYPEEIRERLASLRPVSSPEPGTFDNFFRGTAKTTMLGFATAASGIDVAGGALAAAQDRIMGTGTEAQDRYFREHDDVFGSAVDYWTPRPNEVGEAANVVGGLLSTLPLVVLSPGAAVASTQLGTSEKLVKEGVSADKAEAVGAVQGVGLGLGVWMPVFGKNLWQRIVVGGAGYNVAQGLGLRAASAQILDGTPAADEFKAFDGKAMTLDALLGAAFGSVAHISTTARAHSAAAWDRVVDWAKNLDPSDVDAIAALRQSQHLNVDSAPGKLQEPADVEAHVQRAKAAIDQLSKGEPVAVDDLRAPGFKPDEKRTAAAEKAMASLDKIAEDIRTEEGIAPLPKETEGPATTRGAEPPPPRGSGEVAGPEAIPYAEIKASKLEPEEQGKLTALYKRASSIKPEFDRSIEDIAATVGGESRTVPLKGIDRALGKIESDYAGQASKIKDLLRATIEVESAGAAKAAIEEISKRFAIVGEPRNLLDPGIEPADGYRDAKFNVKVNGHVAEVQVNLPEMLEAKKIAHPLYQAREEIERRANAQGRGKTASEKKTVEALNESMREIYSPVWEAIKARNFSSDTGAPLRLAEAGSNLRGGERSQAAQYSPGTPASIDTGIPSTSKNSAPGANLNPAGTATAEARSIADTSSGILPQGDPYFTEALRVADEHPDLKLPVGVDAEGNPVMKSAREFLADASAEATKIREQSKLISIAAECLLGIG